MAGARQIRGGWRQGAVRAPRQSARNTSFSCRGWGPQRASKRFFFFELSTRRLGKSIVPTCWSEEEDECEECSLTAGPFCLGKDGGVGLKMDAGDGGKVATCLH